jgi:hypothetical protein
MLKREGRSCKLRPAKAYQAQRDNVTRPTTFFQYIFILSTQNLEGLTLDKTTKPTQ